MSRKEADVGRIFPVEELESRYSGRFVLINVIEVDESGWPTLGEFIGSYHERGWALRRSSLEWNRAKQQGRSFHSCVMPKEPYLKTVGEWRALLNNPTQEMLKI